MKDVNKLIKNTKQSIKDWKHLQKKEEETCCSEYKKKNTKSKEKEKQ